MNIAEPTGPQRPMPPEVSEAMNTLLGYGSWLGGVFLVGAMIGAGGLIWYAIAQGASHPGSRKIWIIVVAAAVFGSAAGLADLTLGQ